MNEKQKKSTGKFISLILRHKPQTIGIKLSASGWASVEELLAGLNKHGHPLTFSQLETLVVSNNKQRYRFNMDKTKICANQGHSLSLDLQLQALAPPKILYHGTASRFLPSIEQQGLRKQNRHHVHLSIDQQTAHDVGTRHGKAVILTIAAGEMYHAGHVFYCSENGVWLVDYVPLKYMSSPLANIGIVNPI